MRPGEKLYEELYFDDEETLPTVASQAPRTPTIAPTRWPRSARRIAALEQVIHEPPETIRSKLQEIVSEYAPSIPETPADAAAEPSAAKTGRLEARSLIGRQGGIFSHPLPSGDVYNV